MKYVLIALLLAPLALACIVPTDGMLVDTSIEFCSDVYYFNNGIKIVGENLNINCNGAVFNSWDRGKGFSIEHSNNITVSDCRIINYNVGMYVRNSTNILLEDNYLLRNKIGTRFVLASKSGTFNHDVSITSPFEIFDSESNAFSLTNKVVRGDFCKNNYCNRSYDAVVLQASPKNSEPELAAWLNNQIDLKRNLYYWIFGDLAST